MTRRQLQLYLATICLSLLITSTFALEKWSRQLEATGPGEADSFDWIPLAQPVDGSSKDRSANGRVLTYSQTFPPNAHFGELPKNHGAPVTQRQAPFEFPYQFQRFVNGPPVQTLRQPAALKSTALQSQEPSSQSFFKFEMPYHGSDNRASVGGPPTLQTGYQIQHSFGGGAHATLFNSPLYNQQPVFPTEFHPKQQSIPQKPLPQQNFIEDTLPVKNSFRESKPLPSQQALETVSPQVFPVESQQDTIFELNKPTSFQAQPTFQQQATPASAPTSAGQQEVQLLYVPYDTLYNQQQPQNSVPQSTAFEVNKFNLNSGLPAVNPYQINQFYTQDPLDEPNSFSTSTTSRPLTTSAKPANVFQTYASPQFTTAKPKPKAHQPPLAMFMLRNTARPTQSDVVTALRSANTIDVIDAPTKNTPSIFVGPAGMPIPDGYTKFDLPYLSQLMQTRDLRDVPFFVAPLSYRTPNGFNKIFLPEPHVGSIVVNRAKEHAPEQLIPQQPQQNVVYNQVSSQNDINQYHGQRTRPNAHRVKQPVPPPKDFYPEIIREPNQKNRNPFEVTTQRATLQPSRGNKFSYFYDQDAIHEVTSPKITKPDRPKKKRPQNVQIEQPAFTQTISNPYAQFPAAPNQILNDDYYKVQPNKPLSTTSTSTSTSTTTTSTTKIPPTYFSYNTSPQVQFQSTSGQLYPNYNTATKATAPEHVPRFTTRPPPTTIADEEYRMKQYFRQQEAFRHRPQVVNPTNSPFEQVQYTPVSLDYDREVSIPTTTHKTTTTKQRITFFSPTATPAPQYEESFNTLPPREPVVEYTKEKHIPTEQPSDNNLPINHRPAYNQNEVLDATVEYEPNPYHVPSELPPLTPNLPGLVNGLQEKDKLNAIDQNIVTTTTPAIPETEQPTRPTRRPINRIRKPAVAKVTSSVSYSESESTSKRPSHRVRRPYGTRGSVNAVASIDNDETTTTTTRRPSATRNSLIRNPNRVRYQPTTEERQSLRIKPRKQYNGSKKVAQSEDLEYQRDVLKQNYPVIRPAGSRNPTSPTAIPSSYAVATSSEAPTSESQQIYTVTPSNHIENEQTFPSGILEPMEIAQQYNEYSKENYGPGYFPNQEDLNPTEPIIRNEINPVYNTIPSTTQATTTTTTTEDLPVTTTRRSPFIRRNYPRTRPTTTEAPTTTTATAEEKASLRPRIPPRKVIKVRARTRRPYQHPASSTTSTPEEEEETVEQEPKHNYRKHSRYNNNHENSENESPRRRYKPQFQLEGQESQWSPPVKSVNSYNFKPLNPKENRYENKHKFENEPEIVTAGPEQENKPETYEINVSANLGSMPSETKATLKSPNLKPEKSFAELLEEVMGKAPEEKPLESQETTKTTDGTYFESHKTTIISPMNRRGKWKKLRTSVAAHNNESFETAESQNLGTQLYNSLYKAGREKTTQEAANNLRTTTPMTTIADTESTTAFTQIPTTVTPPTTIDEYDLTTSKAFDVTTAATTFAMHEFTVQDNSKTTTLGEQQDTTEESATRRLDVEDLSNADDLETQPSLFSEVKKQLHELFAIEDNEDQTVNAALAAVGRRRQEYTNIRRVRPESTQTPAAGATTESSVSGDKKEFHKNLMEHVVYATSTSKEMTSETEICYRGRCIRSEDLPANHKLQ